ncbi:MAG: rhodanese-like domain-containing protein [Gammaproteobacteria bacterium]
MVEEITVRDLIALLAEPSTAPQVLDVREPWELALARVEMTVNIPMGQVPDRLGELDPEQTMVVMCHHGNRSRQVAIFMMQKGFSRVINLAGGIDAWSAEVDPTIPRY